MEINMRIRNATSFFTLNFSKLHFLPINLHHSPILTRATNKIKKKILKYLRSISLSFENQTKGRWVHLLFSFLLPSLFPRIHKWKFYIFNFFFFSPYSYRFSISKILHIHHQIKWNRLYHIITNVDYHHLGIYLKYGWSEWI